MDTHSDLFIHTYVLSSCECELKSVCRNNSCVRTNAKSHTRNELDMIGVHVCYECARKGNSFDQRTYFVLLLKLHTLNRNQFVKCAHYTELALNALPICMHHTIPFILLDFLVFVRMYHRQQQQQQVNRINASSDQ